MKKYLVIDGGDGDYFIVDDLLLTIKELYEYELNDEGESFESVSKKFYSFYKVFEIEGEIKIKTYENI